MPTLELEGLIWLTGGISSELAKSVSYKVLQKHRDPLPVLEAILLGQAGLLPFGSGEPYVQYLIRE